jgi:Zn finger protein HypA/HybF involved in hydrogenase expression
MVIYVRGRTSDQTYHWCRNCRSFPAVYAHATPNRPTAMLCPECDGLDRQGGCHQIAG